MIWPKILDYTLICVNAVHVSYSWLFICFPFSYYHGCWVLTSINSSLKIELNIDSLLTNLYGDTLNIYNGKMPHKHSYRNSLCNRCQIEIYQYQFKYTDINLINDNSSLSCVVHKSNSYHSVRLGFILLITSNFNNTVLYIKKLWKARCDFIQPLRSLDITTAIKWCVNSIVRKHEWRRFQNITNHGITLIQA